MHGCMHTGLPMHANEKDNTQYVFSIARVTQRHISEQLSSCQTDGLFLILKHTLRSETAPQPETNRSRHSSSVAT